MIKPIINLVAGYFERKSAEKRRRIKRTYYLAHAVMDFNNPNIRAFNRIRAPR